MTPRAGRDTMALLGLQCGVPTCRKCFQPFPTYQVIAGKRRNLKNRKYCLNCSAFGSHNTRQIHKATRACTVCGAPVSRDHVHCSNACQNEARYRAWIGRWLAGEETGVNKNGVTSFMIKRYLIETRGEKCEVCGWAERNPVTNKVPVTLHHDDGDSDNNRPENLRLLCPNHHSLTANYGNLNRGRARRKR